MLRFLMIGILFGMLVWTGASLLPKVQTLVHHYMLEWHLIKSAKVVVPH